MRKKKRRAAVKANREQAPLEALPDRRAMERIMQEIAAGAGDERPAETPLDRAQAIIYQAFEDSGPRQASLARKALEVSPDCADAYVLLAEHAESADDALALYAQGVAAAERALGEKGFKEYAGHFWGFLETRPYMRAREGLASSLWQAGRREEAAKHYQEMLRLNPNDNQGVRYSLATLLLDLECDEDLRRLVSEYENDSSAEWAYTKALLAFREAGESSQAGTLLKEATKVNEHVPAYLLGHKQLPQSLPPYITMGGEDEAMGYAVGNRRAWLNTPGAVSWLRKTLSVPLAKAPKPRRPSWPELKLALRRLPQERGETWQIDELRDPATGEGDHGKKTSCTLVIVSRANGELLSLQGFDSHPKSVEVWNFVIDAMWRPQNDEPRRPAQIEVCQKTFQTAWKPKLKQIGVDCVLANRLEAIVRIRQQLPHAAIAGGEDVPGATEAGDEDLLASPLEPGDVWQADTRPMPAWVTGEGQPYRPWMAVVVSRKEEVVLAFQTSRDRPAADALWEAVFQAVRRPMAGDPRRPSAIEVSSAELREALLPRLDRAGIECHVSERLEYLDSVLDDMAQHIAGQDGPPTLLDVPGMEPKHMRSFYAAAAVFYRRKPWQIVRGDTPIKVECDRFQSGPWYAVVMGQSGVQQGVAVYEDFEALQEMMTSDRTDEENTRGMSALSLMFSEAFEISVRDLDAVERHGFEVAGPEAYPLVIRINPGRAIRPPLTWELELLEGCLSAIPEFLAGKRTVLEKTVAAASGKLTIRLSWPDRS